ncbi:NAD(P)/FAD-dependent oxidoreductase [Allokutzneria multivorans]|uniref:NAD(P)/FAD-dependent oxidoreductase n=1 Tax=Allokutzneria multivorans TaxID=1142134 RepID=A0ABP7SNM0_9PSEU
MAEHAHVLIIGTGFSGLGAAHRLRERGITDVLLLERADDVGGTWRDNSYPGAACDVPSLLYSFSFAQNSEWSRSFSSQPEILAYLQRFARDNEIYPRCRFGHEMLESRWDPERMRWHVRTSRGEFTGDVLILGAGPLSQPSIPDLPGLESFEGTAFHSARWDHEHDLTGKNVAVVGTGSSAVQFVPKIQPKAAKLHVFQRTAHWTMPRWDRKVSKVERLLFRRLPALQRLARYAVYWGRESFALGFTVQPKILGIARRLSLRNLRRKVADPVLREKLTPNYAFGCKRVVVTSDFYPALTKPNVELVTDGIAEVRPHSIVTADGTERPVDTLIFGTGFHATDFPIGHRVFNGDGASLTGTWQDEPGAYRGTTIAGFPNLFMLIGPNTGLGHTSMVFIIESQLNYVLDALDHLREHRVTAVEPLREPQIRFNKRIQRRMRRTVWSRGGCSSWYLDDQGRNIALWPGFSFSLRMATRKFDPDAYRTLVRSRAVRDELASVR